MGDKQTAFYRKPKTRLNVVEEKTKKLKNFVTIKKNQLKNKIFYKYKWKPKIALKVALNGFL